MLSSMHLSAWWKRVLTLGCAVWVSCPAFAAPLETWLTTEDLRHRMHRQSLAPEPGAPAAPELSVEIGAATGQTLLGLGSSLEPTTCSNLFRVDAATRTRTLRRLVDPVEGIGMNLMRLCIGTPDFTGDPWYSYCDLPPGETDPELKRFSIERDRAYLLPVIREARRLNPDLWFFASPWSPPGWMKSTGTMIGGRLLREWYPAYARYLVRFLQAYAAEGVPIHAITVQNEPGVDRSLEKDPKWHYPSCRWTAEEERDFIRDHLGPALEAAGLKTLIWCYDHNYNLQASGDDPGLPYPRTILQDPGAARWVDGVAFHGYVGDPSGMAVFLREFPQVPVHFTEGSVFGLDGGRDLLLRLRHGASSYNAWVTILDEQGRPNNGPFPATHAILKLHSATGRMEELLEFDVYGHFMRFLERGAVRLETPGEWKDLYSLAFRNPGGRHVAVIVHLAAEPRRVQLRHERITQTLALPARSIVTARWE